MVGLDEDSLSRALIAPLSQAADTGVLHSRGRSPRVIRFWEPYSWIARDVWERFKEVDT